MGSVGNHASEFFVFERVHEEASADNGESDPGNEGGEEDGVSDVDVVGSEVVEGSSGAEDGEDGRFVSAGSLELSDLRVGRHVL